MCCWHFSLCDMYYNTGRRSLHQFPDSPVQYFLPCLGPQSVEHGRRFGMRVVATIVFGTNCQRLYSRMSISSFMKDILGLLHLVSSFTVLLHSLESYALSGCPRYPTVGIGVIHSFRQGFELDLQYSVMSINPCAKILDVSIA